MRIVEDDQIPLDVKEQMVFGLVDAFSPEK